MCDTMGFLARAGESPGSSAFFAKNSDRSPNEVQGLEFYPARDNSRGPGYPGINPAGAAHSADAAAGTFRATYIDVEEAPRTYAVLLSRPLWMWGAEIGVNEKGVCIGNEAVFTRGSYGKTGLTGMDLLRLALERSASAKEAVDCITGLLERYGQGGNCGYGFRFYYDNSFLIIDRSSMYILETAGKAWAYKQCTRGSISNRLGLGKDADAYSGRRCNFAMRHTEPLHTFFSGSARRRSLTGTCVTQASSIGDLLRGLRTHRDDSTAGAGPLTRSGVDSPCMHAGSGFASHSTASMAVELRKDGEIIVWAAGSSTPCISLFKPWRFSSEPAGPVFAAGDAGLEAYWRRREDFHRNLIGRTLPEAYYAERDALETAWLTGVRAALEESSGGKVPSAAAVPGTAVVVDSISRKAAEEEERFLEKWSGALPPEWHGKKSFLSYWDQKTAALKAEARPQAAI